MAGGIHAPGIFSVGLAGALLCGLLILLAVTPASAATPAPAGPKIKVTPENPYYDLLQAEQRPPIRLNARLKGCRIAPYSDCKGAGLNGQKLYGAKLRISRARRNRDQQGRSQRVEDAPGRLLARDHDRGAPDPADLFRAELTQAGATGISLREAVMRKVDAADSTFSGGDLSRAVAVKSDFSGAVFAGVEAHGIRLKGSTLRWLLGPRADLARAHAPRSDFLGSSLRGANLSGANLRQADLRKADLTNANLRNADLREARLAKARLGGAKLCRTRMPNGKIRG